MLKKLIASTLLSIFLLVSLIVPYAHAQTWYQQDFKDWMIKVYDTNNPSEIFGERYTAAQVEWVLYGFSAFILNHAAGVKRAALINCLFENNGDPFACIQQFSAALGDSTINNSSSSYAFKGDSITSGSDLSLGSISGVGYLRDTLAKFRLVKEAKAQGFGFGAASPVHQFWQAVRNLAYFLLVLVIVVMAFMIMFRVKLSPQTVITVQSALPGVIFTLVLITFSYAIAGFMIDLLYVVLGLLAAIFRNSGLFTIAANQDPSWSQMFRDLAGIDKSIFSLLLAYIIWFLVASLGFILNLDFLSTLMALVFLIIAIIVCFFLLFKITWMLLKNFFILLITIVAGPIFILGGLLGLGGFTSWLKSIASVLAIYAMVGPMFALAFFFLANAAPDGFVAQILVDIGTHAMPFTPNANILQGGNIWIPPFLGGQNINFLWLIASLVILTIIPKLGDIIKGALSGRPYPIGTGIGEAIGPIGMGGVALWSSKEAASYAGLQKSGQQIGRVRSAIHAATDVVRGVSGGKIR